MFPVSFTTLEGAGPDTTYKTQFQDSKSFISQRIYSLNTSPVPQKTAAVLDETTTLPLPGEVPPRPTNLAGTKRKREGDDAEGEPDAREPFDASHQTIKLPALIKSLPTGNDEDQPKRDRSQMTPHELEIDTMRRRNLSMLPSSVTPACPELLGFRAGQASLEARSDYFASRKRSDLLNILTFCDQLHPSLLVDILVSVSKRHPGLPIFRSPDWDPAAVAENKVMAMAAASSTTSRRRHGHTLINPRMRQRHKASKKSMNRQRMFESAIAARGDDEVDDEDEDTLPDIWPRAGDGLYSKLPVETDDNAYMDDDNEDEAFSHFMVDSLGALNAVSAFG